MTLASVQAEHGIMELDNKPSLTAREIARPDQSTYIVEPTPEHSHTIILLHDLSSNDQKFGQELLQIGKTSASKTLPDLPPGARFVFSTVNIGVLVPLVEKAYLMVRYCPSPRFFLPQENTATTTSGIGNRDSEALPSRNRAVHS
jgi:hypothetical protein